MSANPLEQLTLEQLPGHSSRGRLERVLRRGEFAVTAELNPPDSADPEDVYNRAAVFVGLGIPLVATADAHYLCSEDARAHDVLFCINTRQMHDPRKKKYPEERMPNPYYVRSPADMYRHSLVRITLGLTHPMADCEVLPAPSASRSSTKANIA